VRGAKTVNGSRNPGGGGGAAPIGSGVWRSGARGPPPVCVVAVVRLVVLAALPSPQRRSGCCCWLPPLPHHHLRYGNPVQDCITSVPARFGLLDVVVSRTLSLSLSSVQLQKLAGADAWFTGCGRPGHLGGRRLPHPDTSRARARAEPPPGRAWPNPVASVSIGHGKGDESGQREKEGPRKKLREKTLDGTPPEPVRAREWGPVHCRPRQTRLPHTHTG
jgi:hypothetical protein